MAYLAPKGWNGGRARREFENMFCHADPNLPDWVWKIERTNRGPQFTHFCATLDVGEVWICVKPTRVGVQEFLRKNPGVGIGFYMDPYAQPNELCKMLEAELSKKRAELQGARA